MKHRGLAQIPLMIGLLLMAVALPVATKLVQDNQDNRDKAAGCMYDDDCGPYGDYTCKNGTCVKNAAPGGCNKDSDCTGGKKCMLGYCVTPPTGVIIPDDECTKDSDCAKDEHCKFVGGYDQCVKCTTFTYGDRGAGGCNSNQRPKMCGTNVVSCEAYAVATAVPTVVPTSASQSVCCCNNSDLRYATCKLIAGTSCSVVYSWRTSKDKCSGQILPTAIPTIPTCRTINETCITDSNCCKGYTCRQPDPYTQEWKCLPPASPTPTLKPTTTCLTSGTCIADSNCCKGYTCRQEDIYTQEWKCLPPASPTPTQKPKPCCCNGGDFGNKCFWSDRNGECHTTQSVDVWLGFYANPVSDTSRCSGANPNPTAKPTTSSCADVGQSCTTRLCCDGKGLECTDEGGLSYPICVKSGSIPTLKPTIKPTMTTRPTSIPCAGTGQACSTRSCCTTANVCTDEGLSYPICVPRNNIPTYIPVPTIKCAKSGSSCTTLPCCEAYLDVCTDEGLSYPKCVPRSQVPTYIPIPTMMPCAKSGSTCSSTLGCCSMSEKCTNGKCVAIAGPSVSPTGVPYITSVPGKCPNSDPCTLPITIEKCAEQCCGTGYYYYNSEHKKYYCGSEPDPTRVVNPTNPPSGACTQCSGKPEAKGKGDADCSGTTDINDASIWRSEFTSGQLGTEVSNSWRADFDCDGKVTLNDISIWRENFIKGLTN